MGYEKPLDSRIRCKRFFMKTIQLYILTIVLLVANCAYSQDIRATTDDGQSVILKKNGTWFFVNRAPAEDGSAVTFNGRVVLLRKTGKWLLTNTVRPVPSAPQRTYAQSSARNTASYGGMHPFLAENAIDLTTANGSKADLQRVTDKKIILLYFSAHWCSPCRAFTPKLVDFYNTNGGGDKFEILFVSSDNDETAMMNYMKLTNMPWVGLSWSAGRRTPIKKKYCGPGIPCLVMLNEQDEVISDSYVGGRYVGPMKVLADLNTALASR